MNSEYLEQVKLLLKVLPILEKFNIFALKGGTAINFFYENLPRLSVDLDLVYTPINDRNTAINEINTTLEEFKNDVSKLGIKARVEMTKDNDVRKLICSKGGIQVKIEPNYIIRGTILPTNKMQICDKLRNDYGSIEINVLHRDELYAGKLCACLDRGHPRDLFDVSILFKSGGITDDMVKCFVVYALTNTSKTIDRKSVV